MVTWTQDYYFFSAGAASFGAPSGAGAAAGAGAASPEAIAGALSGGATVATNTGMPPFISTTTADFRALRFASIVIRPVTPG